MSTELSAKSRVAIVDDDTMVAASLAALLERAGYAVERFSAPEDALDYLAHETVDALVSDVTMPTMTGLEMLARMRERRNEIPVIFITGAPRVEDTMRAMELGAFRYLSKPIERDQLLKVVEEAVRWGRLTRIGNEGPAGEAREHLEIAFNSAMNGLFMAYQPIVAAGNGKLLGYEALMRSNEPTLRSPPAVLDAAEKLGRLHALGRRVRELVATQASAQEFSHAFFVNLHSADLADPQLYDPEAPLSKHAASVVLELTERASLEGIGDVERRLADLRALGFRIAVDDLGAGYAGLSYFARVSPDIVKIDMSLTRDVERDPVKRRIVASMCQLARELSMSVVAEGIETEAELACVTEIGADLIQGYVIGKPQPYPKPA